MPGKLLAQGSLLCFTDGWCGSVWEMEFISPLISPVHRRGAWSSVHFLQCQPKAEPSSEPHPEAAAIKNSPSWDKKWMKVLPNRVVQEAQIMFKMEAERAEGLWHCRAPSSQAPSQILGTFCLWHPPQPGSLGSLPWAQLIRGECCTQPLTTSAVCVCF